MHETERVEDGKIRFPGCGSAVTSITSLNRRMHDAVGQRTHQSILPEKRKFEPPAAREKQ